MIRMGWRKEKFYHIGCCSYLFFLIFYLFFWLHRVLVVAHRIFVMAHGLLSSCGARAPKRKGSVVCGKRALYVRRTGLVVVARGLSCPKACGILVSRPGIEPAPPALEGRFLTTGPPGKSRCCSYWFSSLCTGMDSYHHSSRLGFLDLGTVGILGRMNLCCEELSCAL